MNYLQTKIRGTDLEGVTDGCLVQLVADNVDHQIRTIDGYGTFHGMGIMGPSTPVTQVQTTIARNTTITANDIASMN